jgi:hypothetical protein
MQKVSLKGTIHSIGQTEVKSEKFAKRDLVLAIVDGNYTQYLNVQFSNANCEKLDQFSVGQEVVIPINLRGRLWTGNDGVEKCFNSIEGWAIVDQLEMEKYKSQAKQESTPKMGNIEQNFQEAAIQDMVDDELFPF